VTSAKAPKSRPPVPVEKPQASTTDNRKQSLYFPEDMLDEISREAARQDRSMSWIVQQAWRLARSEIRRLPSVNDVFEGARESQRRD
jgi:uncharacterized small protein (TIGR04563 family)